MTTPHSNLTPTGGALPYSVRASFLEAARFWEPRRLLYNLFLTGVVALWVLATWPHFRPALNFSSVPPLAALAVIANVCYSVAYLVDIPMQRSTLGNIWRHKRWILFLVGTLLAIAMANYWIADEIYPDVR